MVINGRLIYDLTRFEATHVFDCSELNLTTLEGMLTKVYGEFNCCRNYLSSLEHAPIDCITFNCSGNYLIDLKSLDDNKIRRIYRNFICTDTTLRDLDGLKRVIINALDINNNNFLKSLEGIPPDIDHKQIKFIPTSNHLSYQLSWYLFSGRNGYSNYWQEMYDSYLKSHSYSVILRINWPEDIDKKSDEFIQHKLNNCENSNKIIDKLNV